MIALAKAFFGNLFRMNFFHTQKFASHPKILPDERPNVAIIAK